MAVTSPICCGCVRQKMALRDQTLLFDFLVAIGSTPDIGCNDAATESVVNDPERPIAASLRCNATCEAGSYVSYPAVVSDNRNAVTDPI